MAQAARPRTAVGSGQVAAARPDGSRRRVADRVPGAADTVPCVVSKRRCSRIGCSDPAVATLTYAYADSTAVVGPLATAAEPHSYDLCSVHALRLTAPKGWEVVRPDDFDDDVRTSDDLEALADAVREAGRFERPAEPAPVGTGRRGHLRVLRFPDS